MQVWTCYEANFYLFNIGQKVDCVAAIAYLDDEGEQNSDEHANESGVVVKADIIAHPNAVMIKFVTASIAPLAMLWILLYMRITDIAMKPIIILVEFKFGHIIFFC